MNKPDDLKIGDEFTVLHAIYVDTLKNENRQLKSRIAELEQEKAEHPYHEACPKCFRTKQLLQKQVERLKAERELCETFHPRAMKLMHKRKNFVVVAEDEPYFMDVYAMICDAERSKGRWTEIDEQLYQDALIRRLRLPQPLEEK